jgi:hypothetical protein
VAHCGASLAGQYIWSLVYTDLHSTWTEGRAVWHKAAASVLECTRQIEQALPFALLGFDFDNGNEWLNWTLLRFLQQRPRPIWVTRSRPYHKDDNVHVEQKNWMWPRQLLGSSRLAKEELVEPVNALHTPGLGSAAELLPAFHEAGGQVASGQPLGALARPSPNGLPAAAGQRPTGGQSRAAPGRLLPKPGPFRASRPSGKATQAHFGASHPLRLAQIRAKNEMDKKRTERGDRKTQGSWPVASSVQIY